MLVRLIFGSTSCLLSQFGAVKTCIRSILLADSIVSVESDRILLSDRDCAMFFPTMPIQSLIAMIDCKLACHVFVLMVCKAEHCLSNPTSPIADLTSLGHMLDDKIHEMFHWSSQRGAVSRFLLPNLGVTTN